MYKVPINKLTGGLERSTPYYGNRDRYEMREPLIFTATLRYVGITHTNHSVYATWINEETGAEYPMFARDLDELLFSQGMIGPRVFGSWGMRGTGGYYGIVSLHVPENVREMSKGWSTIRKRKDYISGITGGESQNG